MAEIIITDMKINHVYELAKNLREEDMHECQALGHDPKTMLRKCFYESIMRKVTLINGRVAGAWGVTGVLLGSTGHPWLMTSNEVEKSPLLLALAYRRAVKEMLLVFPYLENYCDFAYKKSLKMLQLCGFTVEEPVPYGTKGEPFCKFWVRS